MIGVGGILPLVGFSARSGTIASFPWFILIATLPINLGCAIATSLPDEPSERLSEKRTASVLLGTRRAQLVAAFLCGVSLIAWLEISIRDESVWLRLVAHTAYDSSPEPALCDDRVLVLPYVLGATVAL